MSRGRETRADKEHRDGWRWRREVKVKRSDGGKQTRIKIRDRHGRRLRPLCFVQEVDSETMSGPHLAPSLCFTGFRRDYGVSRRVDVR